MKICNKCKKSKTLIEFVKDKKSKDGHGSTCKECINLASRKRRFEAKFSSEFIDSRLIQTKKAEELSKGFKSCNKCNQLKNVDEFTKDNRSKDGFCTICKSCKNTIAKERYNMIKDDESFHTKKLISNRKYKELHKEQVKDAWIEYNNRPEIKEKNHNRYKNLQELMSPQDRLKELIRRAKQRAKKYDLIFTLEENDLELVEYCPILNIKLNWDGGPRSKNTPSLDKIIPELGYTKENSRIISNFANTMKNSATLKELGEFSKNIKEYIKNEEIVRTIENGKSIELGDKEPLS
jgi:hypothetical protein